jgi:acyl-CoA reductase-like NAD-dependent aldehyde dehydrogenase
MVLQPFSNGAELASVTEPQKDRLGQAVQAAKVAFPLLSGKTWKERRDLLAEAMEELKTHADELCTILTAETTGVNARDEKWRVGPADPALANDLNGR